MVQELRQSIDRCKREGLIDAGLALLRAEQEGQPGRRDLLSMELELCQHGRDKPRVAAISHLLLADRSDANSQPLDSLRKLRFSVLLDLAEAGADAALVALPAEDDVAIRWRRLQGVRLAQHRYRLSTAKALAMAIDRLAPGVAPVPHRREALELAEKLALMEGELALAQTLRDRIRALLAASEDPAERSRAGAEPLRQWRLEIGANPAALAVLDGLRDQPNGLACRSIATAINDEPNATALAFGLLLRLRRAGWIGLKAPVDPASNTIPRLLWLLRRHDASNPALEANEERWRNHHPGWGIKWLDHQPEAIEGRETLPPLVREACSCLNEPAVRADLLRLCLLWQNGGISVDWNTRSLAQLDPLLGGGVDLVLVQDAWGSLSMELIAASAGHPFVKEALEVACGRVLEGEGYSRWDLSGACLLSGVFSRYVAPRIAAGGQMNGVRVISVHELQSWVGLNVPIPARADREMSAAPGLFDHGLRRAALARLALM
jgi:hypothetical protein